MRGEREEQWQVDFKHDPKTHLAFPSLTVYVTESQDIYTEVKKACDFHGRSMSDIGRIILRETLYFTTEMMEDE